MRRLLRDPQPVLDELRGAYGPLCGLGFGPARIAIVGAPNLLHELFSMPVERFRWGHKFNVLGFVVGPGSMIVSDGPDHRRRRASVQTAFSRKRLNGWIPMIVERTDDMIDSLVSTRSSEPVDLSPAVRLLVLKIAVHALLGSRLTERADEIAGRFRRPQAYLESSAFAQLPHPFPFTERARVRSDRRALDTIIDEEIAHRRAEPTGDAFDVLEVLSADDTLSDEEIRDQVVTLIGAGYDTTAAALAWMLWRTTLTPGVWARLRAEADEVLEPTRPNGQTVPDHTVLDHTVPDHTVLARLSFAGHVMRESLRLHPPGAIAPREAVVDVVLGDHTIRKGTLILWSAHLAGRDPTSWADPLTFDPDRFARLSDEQRAIADQAWTPFGRGSRNCIGFALAQMELTLVIARIAQRLDLTATADVVPSPVGMVVNRPSGGAPFVVAPRRPDATWSPRRAG